MRTMVRWTPVRSMVDFERDVQAMFDRFFDRQAAERHTTWTPRMDVFRDGDNLVVETELPGIDVEKDVEIAVENDTLTISGSRTDTRDLEEGARYVKERFFGSFRRTLALPEGFDPESIDASYRHGVLRVTMPLPKEPEAKARTIPVRMEGDEPAIEA